MNGWERSWYWVSTWRERESLAQPDGFHNFNALVLFVLATVIITATSSNERPTSNDESKTICSKHCGDHKSESSVANFSANELRFPDKP